MRKKESPSCIWCQASTNIWKNNSNITSNVTKLEQNLTQMFHVIDLLHVFLKFQHNQTNLVNQFN